MPHDTYVINKSLPPRRWSRMFPITLSDDTTTRNLQYNAILPYRYLHNVGTSGVVVVTYEPDNSSSTARKLFVLQGGFVEGGFWVCALSTGATAGIELYGCLGQEHTGS